MRCDPLANNSVSEQDESTQTVRPCWRKCESLV